MKATAAVLALAVTSGCNYRGAQSLPLPGGSATGKTYDVTIVFADASDLVAKDSVRSSAVPIGDVVSIRLGQDLKARVVVRIKQSVHLPANVTASLQQTSLLGERFVALDVAPGRAPRGTLAPGALIDDSASRLDPDVEQILGALSGILNGGGIGRLQTISRELTTALHGHETDVRGALHDLNEVVGNLDRNRTVLTDTLDRLDRLTGSLARQRETLGAALDSIPQGLDVLRSEEPQLVAVLQRLSSLSDVARRVIHAGQDSMVADLQALAPTLAALAKNGDEIASSLQEAVDIPFPANTIGAIRGDYAGLGLTVDVDVDTLSRLLP